MKVYTNSEGRVVAEAESVRDIRTLLRFEQTIKARAVYAGMSPTKRRKHHTKTHTCGAKYKYLKKHLRYCPEVLRGVPLPIA